MANACELTGSLLPLHERGTVRCRLGSSSLGLELVELGSKGFRDVCQAGEEKVQGENWELQLPILESDVGLTI